MPEQGIIRLQSANSKKYALFLDHKNIINDEYRLKEEAAYELRDELFQFKSKALGTTETSKQRKRKACVLEESDITNSELQLLTAYLELLPSSNYSSHEDDPPFERFWEKPYILPKLHGSNVSGKFQTVRLNDTSYIIPNGTSFYNHDVEQMNALLPQLLSNYDIIIIDPPWRNKYIRRLKRVKETLAYSMLDNEQLAQLLPLAKLIHKHTLVAIWCTNAAQHKLALETQLLPHWSLRLVHKFKWYKLTDKHQLIKPLVGEASTLKQPYEWLYIAAHTGSETDYVSDLQDVELMLSVPSIIHSHKPPLLPWLRQHLRKNIEQPKCLEIFARYLQPQCTSIGLEVLKLMDERLYNKTNYI